MWIRLCVWILISLSFSTLAVAQQGGDQFYIIEDFSKGLQSHTTPYANPDGVANDNLNVRYNVQAGALAKREPQLTYGTCYTAAVKSLFRYYKSDATKYTIENIDQYIYAGSDTSGACTTIGQGNTVGKRWDWITYKDVAIGTDGYEPPVKWDGVILTTDDTVYARTNGDVVTQLGAPFAQLTNGVNLDATSWYQYKVACLNSSGQRYFMNARSNPIKTGSTYKAVKLSDIPLCQTGTTARYIYRTVGDATRAAVVADTSFYKVATISDNSTRVYYDNIADATILGDAAPTWATSSAGINMTPPYAKFSTIIKERLVLGNRPDGTVDGKSTLYVSEVYNPDLFDTNSTDKVLLVRPDDGDAIQMLETFLGQLIVGKDNTIVKILTDNASTVAQWSISNPMSFIGVSAPYSVASMPLGIIYLNRYGLYKFDQSSQLISDSVTDIIKNMSPTAITEAAGTYWNNEYNLSYADLSTGSAINNRVLIFDFARKSFTKDAKYVDSWAKFDSGSDFGTLYAGSSQADGLVTAQGSSPNILSKRYQSDLSAGLLDDTIYTGTEEFPFLELGWGITIDSIYFGSYTINSFPVTTAIIDRKDTDGTWTSPIYDINAAKYDKLYWNSQLGTYGTLTLAIRSATTSAGVSAASWSSEYSNPSGSDISALTANRFVQIRITMSTTDINYTPYLGVADDYLFKLTYSKVGAIGESSVLAMWKSGFQDINTGSSQSPKIIKEANIYYTGTAGTLNFQFENLKGDIIGSFNVDLSQARDPSKGYFGNGNEKVFRYNFPVVPNVANYMVGDKFRLTITENSTSVWKIQRIALRYETLPYVPYR